MDLVLTATPWQWHVPVCVAALKAGKHAATEVPAALTLEECWQLVETAEKANKHCAMLENYCYFRKVMLVLNMVRRGAFGELLHCEGRSQENWPHENWHLFNSNGTLGWVGEHLARRNGNLYPTHGMGPMPVWANINRGDRFDHLVSMDSKLLSALVLGTMVVAAQGCREDRTAERAVKSPRTVTLTFQIELNRRSTRTVPGAIRRSWRSGSRIKRIGASGR